MWRCQKVIIGAVTILGAFVATAAANTKANLPLAPRMGVSLTFMAAKRRLAYLIQSQIYL